MPLNKIGQEVAPVLAVNSTALGLSMTNLETGLKILLLIISIAYTLDKWRSNRVKKKQMKKIFCKLIYLITFKKVCFGSCEKNCSI